MTSDYLWLDPMRPNSLPGRSAFPKELGEGFLRGMLVNIISGLATSQ